MKIPLDDNITDLSDVPYTISYVIRKRIQLDSFNEVPKDKRPPASLVWDGTSKELDEWFDSVYGKNKNKSDKLSLTLSDIEG